MPSRPVALLTAGFRPFFLLGGAFAALVAPLWVLVLRGAVTPRGPLAGVAWHAHEMIFGFTVAIFAGFLLTAVRSWTGRETAGAPGLAGLAALWVAGRLALLAGTGWTASVVDLAFLPALALVIALPLRAAGSARNAVFPAILLALWTADLAMHLEAHGILTGWTRPAERAALHLIVLGIAVITGRIVPAFTRNATGDPRIASDAALDGWAVILAASLVPMSLAPAPDGVRIGLPALAGLVMLARARSWGAWASRREPLLWVLHLGHALVALGLVAEGIGAANPAIDTALLHVLTVGGIGCLTLGMMARVALGHTGRPLTASRPVTAAFALVALAAGARALGPALDPVHVAGWWVAGAAAWSVAFAVYCASYARILLTPRA